MKWDVKSGISFNKYKINYFKQLKKKKISEDRIELDFRVKEQESIELVSKCINPNSTSKDNNLSTGIAIGLVQSGKTSSMELVSNIARDNGFQLIIVMSGLVGTLTKQTQERLYQTMNGIQWKRIYIPGHKDEALDVGRTLDEMRNAFNTWNDEIYNEQEKRTVVVVTMKNIPRLKKLQKILKKLSEENILDNVPTLIIDDECDHASLNTRRRSSEDENDVDSNEEDDLDAIKEFAIWDKENYDIDDFLDTHGLQEIELLNLNNFQSISDIPSNTNLRILNASSATHSRIKQLRKILPNSSYIGYTATPYANLLINTWSNLSPNFCQVLTPGAEYNGSDFFFKEHEDKYILPIYNQDLVELETGIMTPSLHLALRIFILGVAQGIYNKDHESNSARSMFIHTASQVHFETGGYLSHEYIVDLINEEIEKLKKSCKDIRNSGNQDDGFYDKEFGEAYKNILKTNEVGSIISLDNNHHEVIEKALNFIEVIPFNASSSQGRRSIPIINWYDEGYARILIGGHGLDRGYTVEGLTVSYLFRRTSSNLDTSLQRARFFGYHSKYLNLLRIFIPEPSNDFFKSAAKTEKYLREHLKKYLDEGNKLTQWPRIFIANSNADFNLTSSRKIDFNILRDPKLLQNAFDEKQHLVSSEGLLKNQILYNDLIAESEPLININSPRDYLGNAYMKHRLVRTKTMADIKDYFTDEERFSDNGAFVFRLINHFIDETYTSEQLSQEPCTIILMNDKHPTGRPFYRTPNIHNNNISIQSNRSGQPYDKDGYVHHDYLMDLNYEGKNFANQTPTLQIYNFEIRNANLDGDIANISNVPYFYFYAPTKWFRNMTFHIGDERI